MKLGIIGAGKIRQLVNNKFIIQDTFFEISRDLSKYYDEIGVSINFPYNKTKNFYKIKIFDYVLYENYNSFLSYFNFKNLQINKIRELHSFIKRYDLF